MQARLVCPMDLPLAGLNQGWNNQITLRRSLLRSALYGVLLVLSLAVPAGAQSRASVLYEQGLLAYREARYEEAIQLFRKAHELEPHAALLYNLGQAYERTGRLRLAIQSFREYLRLDPTAQDRAVTEAHVKNLEQRLLAADGRLVVRSRPSGATVRIDGRLVGKTPWNGTLSAGTHWVGLEHAGFVAIERELMVHGEKLAELSLELDPSHKDEPKATQHARVRLPTWLALGVTAASGSAALGFEIQRAKAEGEIEDAVTQLEHQRRYAEAEQFRDTARVLGAVGAAAALTGGVLLVLDLKAGARQPRGSRAMPLGIGAAGAGSGYGLVARGRF